jgi:hypothetical protein
MKKEMSKDYVLSQITKFEKEIDEINSEIESLTETISSAENACPVDEWKLRNIVRELGYVSEALGCYREALKNWDNKEERISYIRHVILALGSCPGVSESKEEFEADCRSFCEGFLAGWERFAKRLKKENTPLNILKYAFLAEKRYGDSKKLREEDDK